MAVAEQDAKPDLAQIIAPETLWPEPMDCPDYPLDTGMGQRFGAPRSDMADARAKLTNLVDILNSGSLVREPTKDEAQALFERHFQPTVEGENSGSQQRLECMGLVGWRKMPGDNLAMRIAEAAHLRGYIRKLKHEEKTGAETAAQAKQDDLARHLANSTAQIEAAQARLADLADAEARHVQRVEDERAHLEAVDLRRSMLRRHEAAVKAAHELGADAPPEPDLDGGNGCTALEVELAKPGG